ncbi:5-methyltetrahydropteroyltriglutamate--homocysteine S-methyltransferase [Candidatus Nasuia deltocephalinicola]|uniref:5-methyltetrahydropteroyltriglutamate-- homocysteine S-methyltransferase n=1 Tax=Candidatus Nasuia deltocephalincola TaxID=1160784 RepID=UPI00216AD90C|nr:5-methyltetrahydropteroyltriglutamate--homocysteine S-methyltransferase [Candidatus Nasuia deltocephalinicola]
MVINHVLGQSRIGFNRNLKKYLENCFEFNENFDENVNYLKELKKKILYNNWNLKSINNINYINVGDFSFYDHILDNIFNMNCTPDRFKIKENENFFKKYLILAKGNLENQPLEMKKWFNTNYHYLVPEYTLNTNFSSNSNLLKNDICFAKIFKKKIKFILIGPLTFLKLGKIKDNKLKNRLLLLPNLLLSYFSLINELGENVDLIQIDEPILILNLNEIWLKCLKNIYNILCSYFSNIMLTTYFEEINYKYLKYLEKINFFSIHLDLINYKKIDTFTENKNIKYKYISLGIIDGKNIWKNDLEKSFYIINKIKNKKIMISTSCSLIHIPLDLNLENFNDKKTKNIKNWISFGNQKIEELDTLTELYESSLKNNITKKYIKKNFIKNIFFVMNKKKSKLIFIKSVQSKIKKININNFKYRINYNLRRNIQKKYFKFNDFTTTTIGSFPQTTKIRKIRIDYKNKLISKNNYEMLMKKEINFIVKKQLDYNLDVIVHGEPERNDMVEYFAENIEGFLLTTNGWVQSYGSRYVKPPIIYGDIYIKNYLTLNWIKYSQNLTKKPLKGMLTGPITMIKWSFKRIDQPNYLTSIQIALVLKKEIKKLEKIGIKIIQIDEPAIREFLPIKISKYDFYFKWALKAFILTFNEIKNNTQIHTHVCYSEFNNIINFIKNLNVDVISIETSRSNMSITTTLNNYNNDIGLGIYDIHTKRKMEINYAVYLIKIIINNINIKKIWINPDCGLKTRKWLEIDKSLKNIVYCSKIFKIQSKLT